MEVEAFQRLDPETYYRKFIAKNIRPDGRALHAVRPLAIHPGVLSSQATACSAMVGLGNTKVVAAISLQVGVPSEALPGMGDIDVNVLLTPLCSSKFSVGKPSEQAAALETFIR